MDKAKESVFQQAIVDWLTANTWLEGKAEHYDRALALYPEGLLTYIRDIQPESAERCHSAAVVSMASSCQ